jgi:hypothetical protein
MTETVNPADFDSIMQVGQMMARSTFMVPLHFRDNEGACTGIAFLAHRLNMDPFQVASKAFISEDTDGTEHVAYQAQFFTAIINDRAPIKGRITYKYFLDGQDRYCVASCRTSDDNKLLKYQSASLRDIPNQKSAMWEDDPDQQLAYFCGRNLARRYFPDILMGMYTPEEVASMGDGKKEPRETLADRLKRGDEDLTKDDDGAGIPQTEIENHGP